MEPYLYRGTEASEASSNKIARYHIQICVYDTEAYLAKIENLEYETHGNWIFSIFLRVDSLKKKCLSFKYFWWFFKIYPGAINPEEFLLSNVRIVHCDNHSGFLGGDNVDYLMVTVKRMSLCLTVLDANHEVVVSFRVFFARALLPYNFTPSLQYKYF